MKVTEMACIQGAWATIQPAAKRVLDIGCGTGLLSLMLAQRYPMICIDAIEIDAICLEQARENVAHSIFNNRITCIQGDILHFAPGQKYDFVIVNPPFFENDLKSNSHLKNVAWHSDALPLADLIKTISRLLNANGRFCILVPVFRVATLMQLASEHSFFAEEILQIRHSQHHPANYLIYIFSNTESEIRTDKIAVKDQNIYTPQFLSLMKDFYLKF